MEIIIKKPVEIRDIETWHQVAPPKDPEKQWKNGRSAKELARFATNPFFFEFIKTVLKEAGVKDNKFVCEPEAETRFDKKDKDMGTGGPRNHDLLMIGSECVIGVEAKVSESFGETIEKEWANSKKGENKKKRILGLIEYISGKKYASIDQLPEEVLNLRYQLFTATVGTIMAAHENNKKKAIVLVLVFDQNVTKETSYEGNVANNNGDYYAFKEKFFPNGVKTIQEIECHLIKKTVHINSIYSVD